MSKAMENKTGASPSSPNGSVGDPGLKTTGFPIKALGNDEGSVRRFKTYPAYKDSGVEWLGEVPVDWNPYRLKYCVDLINDKVDGEATDLPYTGLEHVESWTGKRISNDGVPATSEGQTNRFKAGDVLFGKLRPYLAKVLRATEVGVCTGELLVMRPKAANQGYLFNYLLAKDFISVVDGSTYGAKMPRASWEFIGNLPMLLPSDEEQRSIAAFLDRETARIDQLIVKKERQIELLQEKRAALISHAVTKGLNPKARMKDSGIEWLGKIPEHWEIKRLGKIAVSIQTGPFGSQLHASDYVDDGIPVINPANLQDGEIIPDPKCAISDETFVSLNRHMLTEGDIVFARRGEMGRCALVTKESEGFLCGTGSLRLRVNAKVASPLFLSMFLGIGGVRDHLLLESVGSTMDNLNTGILARIPIAVPNIDEQLAITQYIATEQQRIGNISTAIGSSVEKLREYRTALISAAVTGKIDVREEVA